MIGDYYNKTLTVKRITNAQTTTGFTAAETTITTIRCRLKPMSQNERFEYARMNKEANYKLYCDPADVLEGDVLYDGTTRYEVKQVINPMEMNHHLEIYLLLQS